MARTFLVATLFAAVNYALAAPWKGEVKKVDGIVYKCKCYSDNSCWPSVADWNALNMTVGGALQAAVPPGAPCHRSFENSTINVYNKTACAEIQANWINEQWLTDHPIANLWPLSTNNTCLPSDDPSTPCTRGFYGRYVVLAKTREHIKAGIDFARERNLRLIIRNTGHDFMGRSTGFGSLIINTHSFKDVKFIEAYIGPGNWTGSAAVVGAGVQGRELFRQAFAQKPPVVIVGGECPVSTFEPFRNHLLIPEKTVGWAGGYIQGGGHGPLTSIYGMGADNVLAFDAVTVDGEYVTANALENADLFWALKGGGPSTFGVVVAITVKTFPEIPTAGTIININSTHTNDSAVFERGFRIFHNLANHYVDNGMFVYFEVGPGPGRLHVAPLVGPRMDGKKLNEVLKPLFDQLDAARIPHDRYTRAFPTFFEFYIDMFEDEQPNQNSIVGGRLFTRKDIDDGADKVSDAIIFASGNPAKDRIGFSVGHIVDPGYGVPYADNAINDKWRKSSSFVITNVILSGLESWEEKKQLEDVQTNVVGKRLREAGPDGATYVNEGDLNEPDWQRSYWGDKYPRLLEIRKKWDPKGVLYTKTTPGTEDWDVLDRGTKLCKKVP